MFNLYVSDPYYLKDTLVPSIFDVCLFCISLIGKALKS